MTLGRPLLPPDLRRTAQIRVCTTAAEKAIIRKAAQRYRMSASDYVRRVALIAARRANSEPVSLAELAKLVDAAR